jgi:hypothetical protein
MTAMAEMCPDLKRVKADSNILQKEGGSADVVDLLTEYEFQLSVCDVC